MVGRNNLDRGGIRPMALGLEEGERLDGLRRGANGTQQLLLLKLSNRERTTDDFVRTR
jgi:hypothetical protein